MILLPWHLITSLMSDSNAQQSTSASGDSKSDQEKNVYDQEALNYTLSQAGTSYAGSAYGGKPHATGSTTGKESLVSAYSYNSQRDVGKFVKEFEGRTFNVLSDTYYLPTGTDEWSRLDKQHIAMVLGLSGNLYPDPDVVEAILRPAEGERKRVLDLGCGTGVWTIAMAREFPHAEVVGVDLAPCPIDSEELPSNCRFEIDDINLGISQHFREQFDLIHCRLIASGMKDFRKVMVDVEQCLKPGGMVVWMDVDFDMYSNDRFLYRPFATESNPSGSWFQRITFEMRRQAVIGGSDLYTTAAELDAGFWKHELLDPDTCRTASLYLPLGPWAQCRNPLQTQQLLFAGSLMRADAMSMHKAIHPMLIRSGWPAETVKEWSRRADEELSGTREPLWSRIMVAWGRKRTELGQPAPPLTLFPPSIDRPNPESEKDAETHNTIDEELSRRMSRIPYPNYYVYTTQEHSLRQAAIRNRPKNIPPPPLPSATQSS
ncbi:S-adenosyl-L-methionine-dependent methyltransferase [Serendipita vermifera]|nr:S-adenosyl-L-methionine-dependent methyltransferase [Serendipita vermifera]